MTFSPSCRRNRRPGAVAAAVWLACLAGAAFLRGQDVWINEIHYDNASTDAGEGVEIAGAAGTILTDYDLVFYNGGANPANGVAYRTLALSGTIPSQDAGRGVVWFALEQNGIENGPNDGIALYRKSTASVVQFLSYEGALTAGNGPAAGLSATILPVSESSSTPVGHSLQLQGTGTAYAHFTWAGPLAGTPGQVNTSQAFGGTSTTLTIFPSTVDETSGASAATATVTLIPAPAAPLTLSILNGDATEISVPVSVQVTGVGAATFSIAAVADGLADGDQIVTLKVRDPQGVYPEGSAQITVRNVDSPPASGYRGLIRVATFNLLNGVGPPGSSEFLAAKTILQRMAPDVIAFQEISDTASFSDLKALVSQLGIATTRDHLATAGDGFENDSFVSGDFGSGAQSLALASRFPIIRTSQIGRGAAGRKELTRYPLFVEVDVPGVPAGQDPAFAVFHLKANSASGSNEADHFRRTLEMFRATQLFSAQGWDGASRNLFLMGDFNASPGATTGLSWSTAAIAGGHIFSDGSALPATFQLGADISGPGAITLTYDAPGTPFPFYAALPVHVAATSDTQSDGSATRTYQTSGNARLDYLFAPQPLVTAQLFRSEIFNSRLEHAFDGIPKSPGVLTDPDASEAASDHLPVCADFALGVIPSITLSATPGIVSESSAAPVLLSVQLSQAPPPGETLTVDLATAGVASVAFVPSRLQFTGAQTQATAQMLVQADPGIAPHRVVTVLATATGWFPGGARVEIRNTEPAGQILLTQYQEPVNAANSKALEALNTSGADIDFHKSPLFVRVCSNGSATGSVQAKLTEGVLENGAVVVIGDAAAGETLLARGVIVPNGTVTPAASPTPAVFRNAAGKVRFLLDSLDFNGDDAVELVLNYFRADVLGLIGSDPGSAWTVGGVSTANQNIELRPHLATPSAGFADPSARFFTVETSDALTGFGVPPVLADPYAAWAAGFGLTGLSSALAADPDADGLSNLAEYGLGLAPNAPSPRPWAAALAGGRLSLTFRRRAAEPGLRFLPQRSPDLAAWSYAGIQAGTPQPNPDGTVTDSFSAAPGPGESRLFLRLRIERD